jgi:hypothetical protein
VLLTFNLKHILITIQISQMIESLILFITSLWGDQGGVPGIKLRDTQTLAQIRDNFQQLGDSPYLRGEEVVGHGWACKEKEAEEGDIRDILILFPGQELSKDMRGSIPTEYLQLEEERLNGHFIR